MSEQYCTCLYKILVADEYSEPWSTVLEAIFSAIISIVGVIINLRFWKILRKERKGRPPGRKGNVIEPIMRWFGILQVLFWPFELGFLWVKTNTVIPHEGWPPWSCFILTNILFAGRLTIAFNSFFIALIRYVYIVHQQKANQWDFEKVGHRFQILSFAIPLIVKSIELFCLDPNLIIPPNVLEDCTNPFNSSGDGQPLTTSTLQWSLQYLPKSLTDISSKVCLIIEVIIYFNIIELFLYFRIFGSIQR